VLISKVTSGTEAQRILGELTRVMDGRPGVTVRRVDEDTLELSGVEQVDVGQALAVISLTWSVHVRLDA
jgi:hypothetical protein